MTLLSFTTDKVKVRKGEDEFINPGCYGINLARDVRNELRLIGYNAKAGTEDWGWYIVIRSKPYFQWVGCKNISELDLEMNGEPTDVEWGITIVNECGLLHRIFNRNAVNMETCKLIADIKEIVLRKYGVKASE